MPANLLRPIARGERGLCEDTLFIISWIETSLLSANLPHNSNKKMDSCFCGASKAVANNGQSINQIWAHQCNNLLILFLFPSHVLSFTFPPPHLSSLALGDDWGGGIVWKPASFGLKITLYFSSTSRWKKWVHKRDAAEKQWTLIIEAEPSARVTAPSTAAALWALTALGWEANCLHLLWLIPYAPCAVIMRSTPLQSEDV